MRRAQRNPWRRATGPAGVATLGVVTLIVTFALDRSVARAAVDQVWSPFVLVTGLLLIGLVANDDGVFEWLGELLTRISPRGSVVFAGAATVIVAVTATLNLDTAVAFLTPVLIHASRRRGGDDAPWLYGVLLLANAGSLWLPGSNLTRSRSARCTRRFTSGSTANLAVRSARRAATRSRRVTGEGSSSSGTTVRCTRRGSSR